MPIENQLSYFARIHEGGTFDYENAKQHLRIIEDFLDTNENYDHLYEELNGKYDSLFHGEKTDKSRLAMLFIYVMTAYNKKNHEQYDNEEFESNYLNLTKLIESISENIKNNIFDYLNTAIDTEITLENFNLNQDIINKIKDELHTLIDSNDDILFALMLFFLNFMVGEEPLKNKLIFLKQLISFLGEQEWKRQYEINQQTDFSSLKSDPYFSAIVEINSKLKNRIVKN